MVIHRGIFHELFPNIAVVFVTISVPTVHKIDNYMSKSNLNYRNITKYNVTLVSPGIMKAEMGGKNNLSQVLREKYYFNKIGIYL